MLSKFKNVLYGWSNTNDGTSQVSVDYDYREAVISKTIRGALTRSSSFREDLLSESVRNRNNNSNNIGTYKGKSQVFNSVPTEVAVAQYSCTLKDGTSDHKQNFKDTRLSKFRYSRPEFLQLKTDDEVLVSADHQIRPIILPRDVSRLPWKSGYAECINAGKSLRNEDQAACYQDVFIKKSTTLQSNIDSESINSTESELPWVYFGIFDGHAGTAVAVAAATQLHNIIGEKLCQVSDLLIALELDFQKDGDSDDYVDCSPEKEDKSNDEVTDEVKKTNKEDDNKSSCTYGSNTNEILEQQRLPDAQKSISAYKETEADQYDSSLSKIQQCKLNVPKNSPNRIIPGMIDICRNNVSVDSLVTGALESAFWEMDSLIARDKHDYKMPGGCTAIVALFILGKLYVCNAGDSRAIVYKNYQVIPMSFDFTPTSEKERILRLGQQRPEFLGSDFTHLEFIKRPTRRDLGKKMLFKDAYMTGWSMKTITYDDLRFPLVWGEGKRSRVLATIGVTRGFGDHELRAQYGSVLIKPFLTPEPEVKMLPLENDEILTSEDVLIMGSDGLWDVTNNQEAADIVKNSFDLFPDNEESRSKYRYITAAQDLVIHSRGHTTNWNNVWRTFDDKLASLDDIAVFVIPLKQYRDEYLEWKKLRSEQIK